MRVSDQEEDRSVIGRVMAILDAVAAEPGEVGLSELARRTGIKKATVHRLATELVERRMLDRGAYGYRLGFRTFELGHSVQVSRLLRNLALPYMEDLYEISHEIVQLAVLDGTEIVYLEKITGHRSYKAPSGVGERYPAYCSALGKAIIAFSSEAVLDRILAAGLPRRTPRTITDSALYRKELQLVRDSGVAFDREEGHREVSCVAAPVLNPEGLPIVALSITGPSYRMGLPRLATAVREAAVALARVVNAHATLQALPRRHQRRAEELRSLCTDGE
ncbi:IclR family transcriptional regulator [Streptomyces cylindrosporus]|uniref:IclR family transcriptional regulator n=1 Tax=Streptomyces cylindrosporus TaxID=2927583 RepID=A0ABS9Y9T9_9ACTN|nr:IclR family transcriptional regulator [Streptomyces cylindrosporus]MCI3273386.1 IclR family transcriptional regulator [Streptomyces cylindrosporus]